MWANASDCVAVMQGRRGISTLQHCRNSLYMLLSMFLGSRSSVSDMHQLHSLPVFHVCGFKRFDDLKELICLERLDFVWSKFFCIDRWNVRSF